MPVAGPWFFSWVTEGTAFNPAVHNVMDEYVFSVTRLLKEGDKPTLEMVIRNPHIGLLNSARKQWAWVSRFNGTEIVPFFYGRLVAAPKEIFKEIMTVNLVARPSDYNAQRQKLAQEIKSSGPYDQVFIQVEKRDDPDALLEAISGRYCVDPITHEVTISDILNGEDGNVDITADQHLYDELSADFDQNASITSILIDATVTWNQTAQGFVDMGNRVIKSYSGDAIISEWPKPLQALGGGYTVAYSNAIDADAINQIVIGSASYSWTSKEKEHQDGDQLSLNISASYPVGVSPSSMLSTVLTEDIQPGFIDPFGVDGDGDPSPVNIPPHQNLTYAYVPLWTVKTSLVLMYRDLQRVRSERVRMLLQSDLQAIIVDPEVEQNSEVIVRSGTDVGVPIVNLLNWTTIAGQAVALNTIVFPDNPKLPSQQTAQICVTEGTAGTETPNFSDVPGVTTNDGTVVWASLGTPAPTETAYDWTAVTNVGLGTILLPRRPLYISWLTLTQSGRQQFPKVGSQASLGMLIQSSNGFFQVCTLPGLTGTVEPAFSSSRNGVTVDGSVEWTCLGASLPDGKTHFLCVQAGQTGAQFMLPEFDNALHAHTSDGTAVWASIGPGYIPAGGAPGDVWARTYFATARGNKSLEYLISVGRARARLKARAVTVDFSPIDPFGLGLGLTLRKTASVHDTRLGGGVATGKIIQVEHSCDGRTGRETCKAKIGCAIGKDNAITPQAGNPTYCEGYVDGYRVYTDTIKVISDDSDIGYTPPIFSTNDDGVIFPLDKSQIVISEAVRGSQSAQQAAVNSALNSMAEAARLGALPAQSVDVSADLQRQIQALSANSVSRATTLNPVWYDAVLKPISGVQFDSFYDVTLTKLTCAKGVDLEAASTP